MIADNEGGWTDHKSREDRLPKDPLFTFDWVDALIIGAFALAFAGVAINIIFHS